jgi:predicted MPP superfamily phosphohydrolase
VNSFHGRFAITDQRVWLSGLPEAFRGFRILQLSDIHHSLFVPRDQVAMAVDLANRLKPDLIALTGDFVTYSRASIEPVAEILGGLRARAGVVAVLGNHDFRVDAKVIEQALRRRRIEVLRNRHIRLTENGETLHVAGVDDYGYGADLESALRGVPEGAPTVLLAHNPRLVVLAACHGVGLMLSGHTHGGQVNVPLLGTVYGRSPEQLRYKIGWDRLGETQIYVSRGIGTIVLPWRFRCPAEIACLELEPHSTNTNPSAEGRARRRTTDSRWDPPSLRFAAD